MGYIYKKLTAQDIATIPFNAHKQYNYDSASAASNKITYHNTQWTSESISLYSSASTNPQGVFDPINTIKYNQIDHLFYKNWKTNSSERHGTFNYFYQKRELYGKADILSIPAGLYGSEIKPGSFYLSASQYKIVDDTYGNLIISGTNVDNYPTNINRNTFRLDPIEGYKKYDLSVIQGYMIDYGDLTTPVDADGNPLPNVPMKKYRSFFRKGEVDPNAPSTFTNRANFLLDDSYYQNKLKFNKITFQTSSLGHDNHKFPIINFNSVTGSYIASPHRPLYNFNRDDDFSISFWLEPKIPTIPDGDIQIGMQLQGGIVFYKSYPDIYIVYPELIIENVNEYPYTQGITAFQSLSTNNTNIGGGLTNTLAMVNSTNLSNNNPHFPFANKIYTDYYGGYTNWYLANEAEIVEIEKSLGNDNSIPSRRSLVGNTYIDLDIFGVFNSDFPGQQGPEIKTSFLDPVGLTTNYNILFTEDGQSAWNSIFNIFDALDIDNAESVADQIFDSRFQENSYTFNPNQSLPSPLNNKIAGLAIKKLNANNLEDTSPFSNTDKRHIFTKSGTKTIVPSTMAGNQPYSTTVSGNLQFENVNAESQFPYDIYLKSQSLYFDRSDGSNIASINCNITSSTTDDIYTTSHIVCQNSASTMQIWFNGTKMAELDSTTVLIDSKTENNANLYIGSKGLLSTNEGTDINSELKYFHGNIGYINLYDHHLESSSIVPMSESVNNSPYIGNMFYQHGLGVITHPKYNSVLIDPVGGVGEGLIIGQTLQISEDEGSINNLKFQGSHLIYENEYQCTINEHEFNNTLNITARKIKSADNYEIADFTTGSFFKPYITTIGLYNENMDLLVVGKLGQPIRMSSETDTTFILRWDT
jgi:hypothetical protein